MDTTKKIAQEKRQYCDSGILRFCDSGSLVWAIVTLGVWANVTLGAWIIVTLGVWTCHSGVWAMVCTLGTGLSRHSGGIC